MKEILPVLIDDVQCNTPRITYLESQLELAAQLILQHNCLINPILVRRMGVETYHLIQGSYEYYAMVKANEIAPHRTTGTINAIVAEDAEEEALLKQQAEIFRTPLVATDFNENISEKVMEKMEKLEVVMNQLNENLTAQGAEINQLNENLTAQSAEMINHQGLENFRSEMNVHLFSLMQAVEQNNSQFNSLFEVLGNFDHQIEDMTNQIANLSTTSSDSSEDAQLADNLNQLNQQFSQIQQQLNQLDQRLAQLEIPPPASSVAETAPTSEPQPESKTLSKEERFLADINKLTNGELEERLKNLKLIQQKTIDNWLIARKNQTFNSLEELEQAVKGLGQKSLEKILDRW